SKPGRADVAKRASNPKEGALIWKRMGGGAKRKDSEEAASSREDEPGFARARGTVRGRNRKFRRKRREQGGGGHANGPQARHLQNSDGRSNLMRGGPAGQPAGYNASRRRPSKGASDSAVPLGPPTVFLFITSSLDRTRLLLGRPACRDFPAFG